MKCKESLSKFCCKVEGSQLFSRTQLMRKGCITKQCQKARKVVINQHATFLQLASVIWGKTKPNHSSIELHESSHYNERGEGTCTERFMPEQGKSLDHPLPSLCSARWGRVAMLLWRLHGDMLLRLRGVRGDRKHSNRQARQELVRTQDA